jgi:hypothetical protein
MKAEKRQRAKIADPTFNFYLEGKKIHLDSTNLAKLDIKFYQIDLEILFSRAPFLAQGTDEFSYVKPIF